MKKQHEKGRLFVTPRFDLGRDGDRLARAVIAFANAALDPENENPDLPANRSVRRIFDSWMTIADRPEALAFHTEQNRTQAVVRDWLDVLRKTRHSAPTVETAIGELLERVRPTATAPTLQKGSLEVTLGFPIRNQVQASALGCAHILSSGQSDRVRRCKKTDCRRFFWQVGRGRPRDYCDNPACAPRQSRAARVDYTKRNQALLTKMGRKPA